MDSRNLQMTNHHMIKNKNLLNKPFTRQVQKRLNEESKRLLEACLGTFNSFQKKIQKVSVTLPETNIAPTNGWLEYYFPIG